MFHMNVAKVDRDVAHIAMGYTRMFQVYVQNVSSVSDICCKCVNLDVAELDWDVAYICRCSRCFYMYLAIVLS